jgi:hypothetical protein
MLRCIWQEKEGYVNREVLSEGEDSKKVGSVEGGNVEIES